MHRSGTSLVASLLHRAGCCLGDTLLPGDANNEPGYFEDVGFLDLNRRMLAAVVPADRRGHADWGWTEDTVGPVAPPRLEPFVAEADALVAARSAAASRRREGRCAAWGWKDPRTTVLLDFWDARLKDARYVFAYRAPWEVADSMRRLGAHEFLRHPEHAYRIWHYYNEALLAFARRAGDRALLVNARAVLRDPGGFVTLVRDRFDLDLDREAVATVSAPALFASASPGIARLAAAVHDRCAGLWATLEAASAMPSGDAPPAPLAAPPASTDPRIAIVVPCFDQGEYLLEAIASVEHALTVPYELIIVNDGSRERHTLDVLARLRSAGYRVIDQGNRGLANARNTGIQAASCDVVLPLDADNRLRPGFVEAALDVLAHDPDIVAVYGDRREIGLRNGRVQVGVPDLDRLLCGNYIDACAVIRVAALRACGGYDEQMPVPGAEDWDLWLAMLARDFRLHRLDMETFDYRVRPESMLAAMSAPDATAAVERYVLAKHAPLYLRELRRHVDRLARPPDAGNTGA